MYSECSHAFLVPSQYLVLTDTEIQLCDGNVLIKACY